MSEILLCRRGDDGSAQIFQMDPALFRWLLGQMQVAFIEKLAGMKMVFDFSHKCRSRALDLALLPRRGMISSSLGNAATGDD